MTDRSHHPEAVELCLTFDVEERFHSHLSAVGLPREWKLRGRIARMIDWLEEHRKRATCFVVGELAEEYPDLVVRMVDAGCEVASHSHRHLHMAADNREECKEDIHRSKQVLEDLTGEPVYGFRAPSWSARLSDGWLWDQLIELGFRYDSSLFPGSDPYVRFLEKSTRSLLVEAGTVGDSSVGLSAGSGADPVRWRILFSGLSARTDQTPATARSAAREGTHPLLPPVGFRTCPAADGG